MILTLIRIILWINCAMIFGMLALYFIERIGKGGGRKL